MNISKGVITKICKREDMPVDQYGVRADIIFCTIATVNRMNLGRRYEQYINCLSYHMSRRIAGILGFGRTGVSPEEVSALPDSVIKTAKDLLVDYYGCVNPQMKERYNALNMDQLFYHLAEVNNNSFDTKYGLRLFIPMDNAYTAPQIVRALRAKYDVPRGPIMYRGDSGKMVKTRTDVRIGPVYVMALDKINDDNSSVATVPLQHFGVLSLRNKNNRDSLPWRANPTKDTGETEGRISAGYTGDEATAETFDRSNTPITQKYLYKKLLTSDKPTNIDRLVDRNVISYGGTRPLQNLRHIFMCNGFSVVYRSEGEANEL